MRPWGRGVCGSCASITLAGGFQLDVSVSECQSVPPCLGPVSSVAPKKNLPKRMRVRASERVRWRWRRTRGEFWCLCLLPLRFARVPLARPMSLPVRPQQRTASALCRLGFLTHATRYAQQPRHRACDAALANAYEKRRLGGVLLSVAPHISPGLHVSVSLSGQHDAAGTTHAPRPAEQRQQQREKRHIEVPSTQCAHMHT